MASAYSELYQYDQMNQLTAMQRGVLNTAGDTVTSKSFEEDFAFDMTGNWLNYKQDANGDGTFEVNQTRTHNTANEIQTISGGNTLVSHDRNGCMTKVPKPLDGTTAYTLVYDAWNRLTQVKDDTTVVATYMYDARNHRIKKTVGTVVTLSYFNQNWQEIESIAAGVTTTNVYGLRYIDDVIMRTSGNNGETQTLYALQDLNWNVCALLSASGVVQERITYDSFGKPTFRAADFTTKINSSYGWTKTFTGQVLDSESGLMLYRNRYYHVDLGRFITRDPIGYDANDVNLYRYVFNDPKQLIDRLGLFCDDECFNEGNVLHSELENISFENGYTGLDEKTRKEVVAGLAEATDELKNYITKFPNKLVKTVGKPISMLFPKLEKSLLTMSDNMDRGITNKYGFVIMLYFQVTTCKAMSCMCFLEQKRWEKETKGVRCETGDTGFSLVPGDGMLPPEVVIAKILSCIEKNQQ